MLKRKLPIMWQSNHKSWCTRQFCVEWVYETFGPQVKEYLKEKQLPLKCLLVMDNAVAHHQDLDDDLPHGFYFIKVKFLHPNTTHLFQPMDQQVISNFRKLYARALFIKCFEVTKDTQLKHSDFLKDHFTILDYLNLVDNVWIQVTYITQNSAWRKLWPDYVAERDFILTTVLSLIKLCPREKAWDWK